MKKHFYLVGILFLLTFSIAFVPYPIDGYEYSGIKRLKRLELIKKGELKDATLIPPGAMKSIADIQLNLLVRDSDSVGMFLEVDEAFQNSINGLFKGLDRNYSISVLDITNEDTLRYAERNPLAGYQPGSVGKLAVLTGLFTQLAAIYPDSFEDRINLLKAKRVMSGQWGLTDEHTVPIYDIETQKLVKRQVIASDVFSLFEWADHMLSVSNNGAASIVWREALLMAAFKDHYPDLTAEEAEAYFKNTPRTELTDLAMEVVNQPLRQLGISHDEWRLGSFFTQGANKYVSDKGGSIGTTRGLMKYLVQLEQGKVVDRNSSLEIKRLMYMTDRRIRYAQSPALKEAAVYFKSGSLYKCDRSKGESCGKYMGNVQNYMNSVAIVEHPDNTCYIVVLMSNVLRKNSATDHMNLASNIDKIIRK
ncbi:MAG TPA: hypothetical protein PKW08_09040 [Flavobacteriaceae bacterium]|nr:serine hydrolase [Flavobacteriaceae bacterium]MCB9213849.1 serine hydrolase [Alteromonas sp.]HPF11245.1 hypothetical protein [Flavobacteriaceae bacterium]HQU21724.1 hypothetical protein [Flavobacteriaceae bacterium]HQU64536.1 hypothetical protein [Flavobacteriaceae bacterium]